MEKNASAKHDENFDGNGKQGTSRTQDTVSIMMENYQKQLDFVYGMYNNYLHSFMDESNGLWNSSRKFTNSIFSNHNGQKSMFTPFGTETGNMSELFLKSADRLFRQLADYNQNLVEALAKQFEKGSSDWNLLVEKFQRNSEMNFGASRNILNVINDARNKQVAITMDVNRQLQDELHNHFRQVIKDNQEFWKAATKSPEQNSGADEEESQPREKQMDKKVQRKEAHHV